MTNEEIKKHINERLEALKLELESNFIRVTKESDFEDGVWYKSIDDVMYGLYNAKNTHKCNGFIDSSYYVDIKMTDSCFWQKVTDFTELEELLKKEAVKRGMIDGVNIYFTAGFNVKVEYPLTFRYGMLLDVNSNILMSIKGKWAEVVKEKTTEEWLNQLDAHLSDICGDNNTYLDIFIKFFEQNNLEITQKK